MPLNFVAKVGISVAMMAVNMALTASKTIEGPRLDSTKFTGGDFGAPLQMVWGKRRLEVPIFFAEDLKEVRRRRKTKGGKFNEYTYYGTWAVALAGHEIEGISRIWFDTHLVYDLTGEGPVTPFDFGSAGIASDFITLYLGTETQEPDPRMQATIEALHGEGSCPAYRGTAYIMFKDVPLEKIGNRIPQVSVEVLTAATETWPSENLDTGVSAEFLVFSPDFSYGVTGSFDEMGLVDLPTRQMMIVSTLGEPHGATTNTTAPSPDGLIYGLNNTGSEVWSSAPDGSSTLIVATATGQTYDGCWPLLDGDGEFHYGTFGGVNGYLIFDGAEIFVGDGNQVNGFFTDLDGEIWATGVYDPPGLGDIDTVFFYQLTNAAMQITVPGLTSTSSGANGAVHYRNGDNDRFVFYRDGNLYAIDPADGTVLDTFTATGLVSPSFINMKVGATSVWCGGREVALADLTEIRAINATTWGLGLGSPNFHAAYHPSLHALITDDNGEELIFLYLDRVGAGSVLLSDIASDVADMVGVEDYDFSALDQVVQGWSATQGQASNMLEPLLDAFDSDIRPHDFTLQGIKRTGVSTGTILTERFVAGDPRYSVKIRQAAELPLQIEVSFADVDAEQQPNTARSPRSREATAAKGIQGLDMGTWATDATEARQLTDRYFRRLWNQRKEVSNSLTAQMLALEPGDCRTLDLDGETDTYRLISLVVKANDVLATEWKYDHPSLAILNGAAGAGFDGRNEPSVVVPILSQGFILDTPYIQDGDAQTTPIIYALAGPYGPGAWPGATVYQAIGGEYSEEVASVTTSQQMTWGVVSEELPYVNPNLWDRASEITVELNIGTLAGCTEADVNANPNHNLAAIGKPGRWEFVNFTNAELTDPNTYTVSGFKRGRRGTEWAAEDHETSDYFILLDTAQDTAMGLDEVGTDLSFKAITAGRTTGFAIPVAPYTGASLKPYAPCHLEAVKEANDDWTLTWIRRTRVGGTWTSGTSIPLSEVTEEYEVEILDSMGDVVRTFAGLTSPTVTYTAAQQITDGGDVAIGDLDYRVFQISDAVDRGFPAEATA